VKVVVEIIEGARKGQRLTFDAPRTLRFGRHPDNEVAFDANADRDASSRHAELRLSLGGYRLFDLSSANGTLVAGKRLSSNGLAIELPTEVGFGEAGPRCRITVVADGVAMPETFHRPGPANDLSATPPSAPAVSVPVTPISPRKFGAGTVAGIVDEALRRARSSGRRQGVVIAIIVALVAAVAGAAAAIILRGRPAAMRKELAALVAAQAGAGEADRAALQGKIDKLAQQLGRRVDIAKRNRGTVFLVVSRGSGGADGFCTAFAATSRRLLTNAHCVQLADELRRKGSKIEIVPNGGGAARQVSGWKKAAGFRASSNSIGTDVGWLEVDADLPEHVELAPMQAIEAIAAGDNMSTYGFPGRLADVSAPEATYVAGVIGRVTALDGRPGGPAERQLLQHSAFTSAGTSGSPLFDAEGRVIGINAGGYLDDGGAGRPLPGYNFGMRIDLALSLLNEADQ
jgi:V8-like Glu-specific endopeptidase